MASESQQEGLPLSPWAERYGLPEHNILPDDVAFHRDEQGTGVFRYQNEVDQVFMSEMMAKMKTRVFHEWWKVGVSNIGLRFSHRGIIPGGHERAAPSAFKNDPPSHPGWMSRLLYEGELIVPREDTWFPFLAKDRWYDWTDSAASPNPQVWSVDDPAVWEVLRIALELVNRVLRTLIADQHSFLQTLVWGHFCPWDEQIRLFGLGAAGPPPPFPSATLLISYQEYQRHRHNTDQEVADYMEAIAALPREAYVKRINQLLETHVWTFGQWEREFGRTLSGHDNIIVLDCGLLRTLIEGEITLAERSTLLFFLVKLMLHELAHSIFGVRAAELFGEDWSEPEPFIDFAGSAEIGNAFEMAVWGGRLQLGTPPGRNMRPPLGLISENWPYPYQAAAEGERSGHVAGHADFAPGRTIELSIVTSEFISRMLSETFWNDNTIPRKSDNHFHRFPLFVSRTPHQPTAHIFQYINNVEIDKRRDPDTLSMLEKIMVREWKEREARLLMMAALPVLEHSLLRTKGFTFETETYTPSRSAPPGAREISIGDLKKVEGGYTLRASRFFDPMDRPHQSPVGFDQMDYLDQVRKVIQLLATYHGVISKPWLTEILRVEKNLREEREITGTSGTYRTSGTWDFEVPEYDPNSFIAFITATGWTDVDRDGVRI
ncbi:hypothetical protein F5Y14DRAFT_450099 [Nemania sp. NC0429]|nr:hypothetical protein F5Y14DRAFT_450099 [Nemania sp. NC0429]